MTVGELRVRMSAREFTTWRALHRVEPFGPQAWAVYAAGLAHTLLYQFFGEDAPHFRDLLPAYMRDGVVEAEDDNTPIDGDELMNKFSVLRPRGGDNDVSRRNR